MGPTRRARAAGKSVDALAIIEGIEGEGGPWEVTFTTHEIRVRRRVMGAELVMASGTVGNWQYRAPDEEVRDDGFSAKKRPSFCAQSVVWYRVLAQYVDPARWLTVHCRVAEGRECLL